MSQFGVWRSLANYGAETDEQMQLLKPRQAKMAASGFNVMNHHLTDTLSLLIYRAVCAGL